MISFYINLLIVLLFSITTLLGQTILLSQDVFCNQYSSVQFGNSTQILKFQYELQGDVTFVPSTACPDSVCFNSEKYSCLVKQNCYQTSTVEDIVSGDKQDIVFKTYQTHSPMQILEYNTLSNQINQIQFDLIYTGYKKIDFNEFSYFGMWPTTKSLSNIYSQINPLIPQIWFALVNCNYQNQTNVQSQMGFGAFNQSLLNSAPRMINLISPSSQFNVHFSVRTVFFDQTFTGNYMIDQNYHYIDMDSNMLTNILNNIIRPMYTVTNYGSSLRILIGCTTNCKFDNIVILSPFGSQQIQPIVIDQKHLFSPYNSTFSFLNIMGVNSSDTMVLGAPFFYESVVAFTQNQLVYYDRIKKILPPPPTPPVVISSSSINTFQAFSSILFFILCTFF